MNKELKENKTILRQFMQDHYTDAKLAELLDHARSGKLAYCTCCCFIGVATATHALRTEGLTYVVEVSGANHLERARALPGATYAENAYKRLAYVQTPFGESHKLDAMRRTRIIPMILAEIKRRQRIANQKTEGEVYEIVGSH